MRKKLLTLATVCTLCVSGASAFNEVNEITDKMGVFTYTWESTDEFIISEGEETVRTEKKVTPNIADWSIDITWKDTKEINDLQKMIFLTLTGQKLTMYKYPQIQPWEGGFKNSYEGDYMDVDVYSVCEDDDENLIYYVDTETPEYADYEDVMMKAQQINSSIIKGDKCKNSTDADDYQINPDLYYIQSRSGKKYSYSAILFATYDWEIGTTYTNSAITYVPQKFKDGALKSSSNTISYIEVTGVPTNFFTPIKTDLKQNTYTGGLLYNGDMSQLYVGTGLKSGNKYYLDDATYKISEQCLANLSGVTLIASNPNTIITGSGQLGGTNNTLVVADELTATPINDKTLKVSGVVTAASLAKFDIGNYLNADFTEAIIASENKLEIEVPTNKLYYFAKDANVSGTNVVINKSCESYVIKDTENGSPVLTEIYVYKPFVAEEAIYERSFTRGKYGTLIMPFGGSNANSCLEYSALTTYDPSTQKMVFTREYTLAANKPYLVYATSSTQNITEMRVQVNATIANSIEENGATIIGTYSTMYASKGDFDLANDYMFNASGALNFITSTNGLRPGRAYMNIPDGPKKSSTQSITIDIVDEDGIFTTINGVDDETDIDGVVSEDVANNTTVVVTKYYDMNGTQVNTPVAGLNIVKEILANGKINIKKVVF